MEEQHESDCLKDLYFLKTCERQCRGESLAGSVPVRVHARRAGSLPGSRVHTVFPSIKYHVLI